jgi:hypothetical protein
MITTNRIAAVSAFLAAFGIYGTAGAACSGPPAYFSGSVAEFEAELRVKAGTGCRFSLNGIEGVIKEAKITQQPKIGRAGVEGLDPYYVAKAGYQGPDEFAYSIIGTDQYGGPMRVTIKRKVTVVP